MFTKSVLIVDDVPENINVAANILLSEQIEVSITMSGVEALDVVEESLPNLILLDLMMPDMDGYETCRRLKLMPKVADIPIIFLTAKNDPDSIIKAFEAGAVDYITKPFNSAELLARVNAHLKIRIQQALILEHERKLSTIYNSTNEAIIVLKNEKIVFFNNRLSNMFGYNTDQITDKIFTDFVSEDHAPLLSKYLKTAGERTGQADKSIQIKTKKFDNSHIYIKLNAEEIPWDGETAILVLCTDITAERHAQERLFEINAKLELLVKERTESLKISELNFINLFDKSNDSVIINTLDGRIVNANQSAADMLGYTREELCTMNTDQIIHRTNHAYDTVRSKMQEGTQLSYQIANIAADGRRIPVEVRSTLVDYFGTKHVMSSARDISERLNAEKIRMETIIKTEEQERKRFAKDLHDGIGATLSATKMYLNIVKRAEPGSERSVKMIDEAIELIDKAAKNTKEIAVNILPHDLAHFGLVTSLANFVERLNSIGTVKVTFESSGYRGILKINEEIQLFRTVNELINNTLKYAEAQNIRIMLDQKKNKVLLVYTDDGKGFDVAKILNSNKSGIGLDNIIQRSKLMNGNAIIESESDKGMTAKIFYNVPLDRYEEDEFDS